MPVKFNYIKDNDKYAQCYRLLEVLRIEFNLGNISFKEHEKLEDELLKDLLKLRAKIKADLSINTNINDITLTP